MSKACCIYKENLETIKTGVLSLKASGADGFEGLLRIVLSALTDIQFRLAASGLQGGLDGDSAIPEDAICFEAKRYSSDISRSDVLVKIADLARKQKDADRLWVLGATTEVSAQLAAAVKEDGERNAISTLILDWIDTPLPLLAIAVVAAGDPAINFIVKNYFDKTGQRRLTDSELKASFQTISRHPEFNNLLKKLKSSLNGSKLALMKAMELNREWRTKTFCDSRIAQRRLGQGLAVLEDKSFPSMRNELRAQIAEKTNAGKEVILLGDEGHGKSWLSAQLCDEAKGLALFVSAEQLDGVSVKKLDDFLIDRLIEQTNEAPNELLKSRWRHRLQAWKSAPPQAQLLVVIDGLNQRQYIRWDRLLNEIQSILAEIGGRLIVTSRPHFWRTKIERGLTFNPTVIEVPEWSPAERNTLLAYYDISVDWLDKPTLKTLQNPRLLSIAVATLPHRKPIVWEGLTTNRLLMEHLRASQRENFEDETFDQLTMRLSVHAKEVLHRVQSSSNIPPHNFQADSNAVIETRFYRPIRGPGGQYELREEGLTLALGFALVDQLWQTLRAQQDLVERINKLLDPVRAMDRTTDVLFASLLICALDDITFDTEIFSALLDAFANLQNVDDHRFEELVGIVMHQPKALYDVLKTLCLERSRRINKDWFIHAAFEVAKSKKGWQAAEAAIHQWLRCYNKNHLEQINRYNKRNDAEYKKRLEEKESEIREVLSSLSAFEKQTLDQMTEVLNEIDELHTLALRLLAGRSLVSFADSFVAMGLAFALDRDVHSARKAFQQLTTFNRIARSATRVSFKRAIEPLCNVKTSKGGQWTVVRMLCATGDEADATIANTIAEKLRKNWEFFSPPSPDKWRQAEVANPEATRPIDMDEGIQLFNSLEPSKLLQTMGIGSEDHYFREFLAVACRFESAIAVEKTRAVLTGMLTRSGFPLRQVILNCGAHVPLVTTDLADNVINRVEQSEVFETLPENEQLICRMYVFYYIAAQISADDQLRCMTSNNFGSNYLLKAIPSFKPQSTSKIVSVLKDALKRRNENSVYSALTAALYGTTQINTELEKLILQCSRCNSSMIRSVSYQLALKKRLDSIRHSHTKSNWNGTSISEKTDEYWYGSMLLVEACYRNELSIEELLNRITYKTWFASSNRLDTEFTIPMVDSFLKKLRNGVAMAKKIELPFANLEFSRIEYSPYPFVSIEESSRENKRFTKESNIEDTFGADGYFEKKQNKLNSEANIFFSKLKESDAKLLIQEITIENLKNIIVKVPSIEADLLHILEQVDNVQFIWFKNLAFALANLISKKDPERAVSILNRACSSQCFITITLGDDLTLEHQAIWGCSASSSIEKLWRQRLLSAENDAVLAREILAAERFGATDFVKSLIQEFASSEDNLDQAYAISITGYSTHSSEFIDIVSKHMNETGLCAKAAKYAYSEHEKAKWTQEWIEKMWKAATPEEFWRNLTIAKTCMDARVSTQPPASCKWLHYVPVFRSVREEAIKDRNKERKKRLIGQEAPEAIFLNTD